MNYDEMMEFREQVAEPRLQRLLNNTVIAIVVLNYMFVITNLASLPV